MVDSRNIICIILGQLMKFDNSKGISWQQNLVGNILIIIDVHSSFFRFKVYLSFYDFYLNTSSLIQT